MYPERQVKFFHNGRNRAVRIPREFEMPGDGGVMRREGTRLISETRPKRTLIEVLDSLPTLGPEDWVDPIESLPVTEFDL